MVIWNIYSLWRNKNSAIVENDGYIYIIGGVVDSDSRYEIQMMKQGTHYTSITHIRMDGVWEMTFRMIVLILMQTA